MKRPSRRIAAGTALAGAALSAAALTTAVAGPADAASVPSCTGSNLVVGYQDVEPAAGNAGIVMEFRNRGAHTCRITGYPGFDAVDSRDRVLAHAERSYQGYLGGSRDRTVPVVNVKPGHYASAIAEWPTVSSGKGTCRYAAGVDFTPAGTSKTVHRTTVHPSLCHLEVHPTTYGRAGQHG